MEKKKLNKNLIITSAIIALLLAGSVLALEQGDNIIARLFKGKGKAGVLDEKNNAFYDEMREKALSNKKFSLKKAMESQAVLVSDSWYGENQDFDLVYHEATDKLNYFLENTKISVNGSNDNFTYTSFEITDDDIIVSLGEENEKNKALLFAKLGLQFPLKSGMEAGIITKANLIGSEGNLRDEMSYEDILAFAKEVGNKYLYESISLTSDKSYNLGEPVVYYNKNFGELYVYPVKDKKLNLVGSDMMDVYEKVRNQPFELEEAMNYIDEFPYYDGTGYHPYGIWHPKYGEINDYNKFRELYNKEGRKFLEESYFCECGVKHYLPKCLVCESNGKVYVQEPHLKQNTFTKEVNNNEPMDLLEAYNCGFVIISSVDGTGEMTYDEFCELVENEKDGVFDKVQILFYLPDEPNGIVYEEGKPSNLTYVPENGSYSINLRKMSEKEIVSEHIRKGQYFDLRSGIATGMLIVGNNEGLLTVEEYDAMLERNKKISVDDDIRANIVNGLAIFDSNMNLLEPKLSYNAEDDSIDIKIPALSENYTDTVPVSKV